MRVTHGMPQGWFAPTYRMMTENYRDVKNRLAPMITRASETAHRLELQNGAVIDFWSLDNFDAARGRKYKHVTVNEAAAAANLIDAWNYVIRPTLADYEGGADIGSTPKGMNGFYQLWQEADGRPDWARVKFTTYDNPHIPRSEIDEMARALPVQVFKQEILAEFLADGSYFQNIDAAAVIDQPDTPDQHRGHTIVFGVDWGKSNDWTVITVACRQCNRVVDWQRFNQIDYHIQRGRLAQMVNNWHPLAVLPERNSIGAVLIDELERDGIPVMAGSDGAAGFNTTATTKADIIESLHMALVRDKFLVPKDYGDELRAYEIEIRAGAPKFGAPSGLHDDRVMSLALAWRAAIEASPAIIGW